MSRSRMIGAAMLILLAGSARVRGKEPGKPVRLSAEEAGRTVRLLDDVYQSAVINTHKMYVRDPGTPSAVTWAKQVLRDVNGKGWPAARVFAASQRPLNPENDPADAFEEEAVKQFQRGQPVFERLDGDVLRYASSIRVVDRSCLTCHVHNREGDLLGGISYRAPLLLAGKAALGSERPGKAAP